MYLTDNNAGLYILQFARPWTSLMKWALSRSEVG